MQQSINIKLASFIATLAFAFALALPAFAYSELEVEIDVYDDGAIAEVSYTNSDDEEIDEEFTYDVTSEEDIIAKIVADLADEEITVAVVTEAAVFYMEDGSVEDEEMNDDDEDDEDDDSDGKDKSEFCEKTKKAAGFGVAKKCADKEGYQLNDKLANKVDRFAEFGKTNDKAELQNQLRTLLVLLVELLSNQRPMMNDA